MRKIFPVKKYEGTITVPGDKSIAHRAALLSILAKEPLRIINFPDNQDCRKSLDIAEAFGVDVNRENKLKILYPPSSLSISENTTFECGNSGTTARLTAGLVAGLEATVTINGDDSLGKRPMNRVIEPLTAMGAVIEAAEGHLPMKITGKKLLPFEYQLPVASAQVKSALLMAGLASHCSVTIREIIPSRDHTEILINTIGEGITVREIKPERQQDPHDPRKSRMVMPEEFKKEITLNSRMEIIGGEIEIPGDFSTAAFFMAGAAIGKGEVTIKDVGLNPTRTEFLEHLKAIGCQVKIENKMKLSGEVRGDVTVTGGNLKSRKLSGETIVRMIDEIPIAAVMAAFAEGTTIIRDAGELRFKESDRLLALAENLQRMNVKCGLLEDGLVIEGRGDQDLTGADFITYGDHRIAMAFSIAALFLTGPSTIDQDDWVAVSCPEFYELVETLIK